MLYLLCVAKTIKNIKKTDDNIILYRRNKEGVVHPL